MSPLSTMQHSRDQWQDKAKQRGERERYQRKQHARLKAERNQATQALKAPQARRHQLDAHRHQLVNAAPSLRHVHCIGVSVAESWTGESIADVLDRLIAQMGRPAASLKDGGSDRHYGADALAAPRLGSPC